ncbi:EAL domain-containing protein [Rhizobium sp. YIM 134829]|uniref:putative bifunctional diguanylate cyclase/phosphodiesterase n=1 Tax=Rhizobium sp. YIM 134829 TaxID=3390453 RepID=UPI00397CB4A3
MSRTISRSRERNRHRAGSDEETRRLIAASEKLVTEVARLYGTPADLVDRHYWLETMVNHIPDYIYAKDTAGRFLIANHATVRDNSLSDMRDIIGLTDFDLHPPEIARAIAENERRVIESGEPLIGLIERAAVSSIGERWLMTSKVPLRDQQGRTIGIVGVSRDITDRKKGEHLLIGQARVLEMIAKGVDLTTIFRELITLVEANQPQLKGAILLVCPDGEHLHVGSAPNLDPRYASLLDHVPIGPKSGSCGTAAYLNAQVVTRDIYSDERWADYIELVRPFGFRSCWSTPIRSYQGEVLGTFALYSETDSEPTDAERELQTFATNLAAIAIERDETERRIHFMAHHDALTGLPNRTLLDARVCLAIEEAAARQEWVALAFIDLDNFKLINDSLGHHAGDDLLRVVARRMTENVRKSDMIVRVGGDEFIILLTALPADQSVVLARLEAIRASVSQPMEIDGRMLQVSCSMGVVTFPDHGVTPSELLANADAAMYRAKAHGRNNLKLFSAEMAETARAKLLQVEELRLALERDEFCLRYQPQQNIASGRIFAAEALLRWEHPKHGLMSPGDFVPLAEETGLIVEIGEWVLAQACRQAKAWQEAGLPEVVVSVNVSARQFAEKGWVERVAATLLATGLPPRLLELEITESLIMQDVPQAIATMHALEEIGVEMAIDDFGTGYSSLSALKRFPVRRLKIDRSFVKDIPDDEDDMAITAAIVSLAQKLELDVIAEGVETVAQLEFLRSCGCRDIQGYLVARPLEPAAFAALLSA